MARDYLHQRGVPAEAVRAELARILRSRLFASSTAISDLVRFAVEKTLAGESAHLKEYSIGTAVFHRKESLVLSKNPMLRVVARASCFQFKGANQDVRLIGSKLGAQYVVDGTVRRSGAALGDPGFQLRRDDAKGAGRCDAGRTAGSRENPLCLAG